MININLDRHNLSWADIEAKMCLGQECMTTINGHIIGDFMGEQNDKCDTLVVRGLL